jgi:hypothetical protein
MTAAGGRFLVVLGLDRDIAVAMAAQQSMCQELEWIEMVECPGCWPRPGRPCLDLPALRIRAGATPRYDLPRMYHDERRIRAQRKVGFPRRSRDHLGGTA